jgi:hypothetical protein
MVAQQISVPSPAILDREVASLDPPHVPQAAFERDHARLCLRVAGGKTHQHADPPHLLGLRGDSERPSGCRTAYQRDELAPLHAKHPRSFQLPRAVVGRFTALSACLRAEARSLGQT